MPYSFAFPNKPLLHKRIEDQWFERSPKDTQSTLTGIEAAEEAYAQNLARITTPEVPPVVLGRAQHLNTVRLQQQVLQAEQQGQTPSRRSRSSTDRPSHDPADDASTVVNPRGRAEHTPSAEMFWNRIRTRRSAGGDR